MFAVADTERLVADRVITSDQARVIESRAREAMVILGINALLTAGIAAATAGLIFWLASPLPVALVGCLALAAGAAVLASGSHNFRMFGNAGALIGAGMLIGGASLELADKHREIAGPVLTAAGLAIALAAGWLFFRIAAGRRFVLGAVFLMGLAAHVFGVALLLQQYAIAGLPISLFYLYAAGVTALAGWLVDVRAVTALAIVPFAQALDTGTFYFHAAYVFYSPEPTLSIVQMGLLIGACLWLAATTVERHARHARILATMAFIVANLCALVGSLWGDVVGLTLWGPGEYWQSGVNWDQYEPAREAFKARTLVLSPHLYSILWAVALVLIVFLSARRNNRALFNAALTFGAIHAYTQLFESFFDQPLAYVIGGLAAIPLAWGMWRLNQWMAEKPRGASA